MTYRVKLSHLSQTLFGHVWRVPILWSCSLVNHWSALYGWERNAVEVCFFFGLFLFYSQIRKKWAKTTYFLCLPRKAPTANDDSDKRATTVVSPPCIIWQKKNINDNTMTIIKNNNNYNQNEGSELFFGHESTFCNEN